MQNGDLDQAITNDAISCYVSLQPSLTNDYKISSPGIKDTTCQSSWYQAPKLGHHMKAASGYEICIYIYIYMFRLDRKSVV